MTEYHRNKLEDISGDLDDMIISFNWRLRDLENENLGRSEEANELNSLIDDLSLAYQKIRHAIS